MLTNAEILNIFNRTGVLQEGHFRLTSGYHSPQYMQCAQLLQYPVEAGLLCSEIAVRFKEEEVDVVMGPAVGGIIVAYEIARAIGCRSLFCERENGQMALRRGFHLAVGERVLVVEDVVTTGGSVSEAMKLVRQADAKLVGVGLLVDRSAGKVDFGVKTEALLKMSIEKYPPEDCPLCKQGLPVIKPGSREVIKN
ncbi:MAG: orotate phosphoribosyltransferase [bacterium]|jgi:orotate phosphoribosyltransferase|nr:orotate phosphoribosyltransferase [bacterium]MDD3805474.1 orotate phosphoribosyltransferase [bacterium]MDD4152231.1 orotate phosphoribosyltransferase [bacterium]MDD4557822.1 orotate phosphoribosyltransferase [bacterium]